MDRFRKIFIHEHPLPPRDVHAKTVVFELAAPKCFVEYREATWNIIGHLALPDLEEGAIEPKVLLREYSELKDYIGPFSQRISLASMVKSFLYTHYKMRSFPVEWDQVDRPNPMHFRYYDEALKVVCISGFRRSFANYHTIQFVLEQTLIPQL